MNSYILGMRNAIIKNLYLIFYAFMLLDIKQANRMTALNHTVCVMYVDWRIQEMWRGICSLKKHGMCQATRHANYTP